MQIRLIDRSIQTTPGMLEFVHSHITAAVRQFASRVREIRVQIADVNGPKGGLDKRCVILATVSGGRGHVIARHRDSEFYATIAGAAHALKRLVARRIDRDHTKRGGAPDRRRRPPGRVGGRENRRETAVL